MKAREARGTKKRPALGDEQVRVEMRTFLEALASYPQSFAANPRITFEAHRISLIEAGRARSSSSDTTDR